MHVVVTRPAAQAAEWLVALHAEGIAASALPLIGIAAAQDPAPVQKAWAELGERRLVVFVSPNAAEQFFAARSAPCDWPAGVLAGSPGPGTTQVLRRLGVPAAAVREPAADAPQFDSESLWATLAPLDWCGASTLIVRGDTGREWLGEMLKARGATVETVAAYRRTRPVFDERERTLLGAAISRPVEHLWFFSSSEAIDNLAESLPAPAPGWATSRALATHPRIAERARRLGFGTVVEARPSLSAVVACIQSWRP